MYRQEKITPYNDGKEKGMQVEQMFDNIAPTYDTLNHRLSWEIDKGWRRKAIRQVEPFTHREVLDIATGTGDFAILAAKMLSPERLLGVDFSEGMQDLDKGLSEMCRVLRKGGHLSILELSQPVTFPFKQLFWLYSHTLLPIYGKIISKDKSAYKYLTATIEAFPQGEEMAGILKRAGFSQVKFKRLTFGVCTMYMATK